MTTSQKLSDVLQFIRGVTFSPEELVTGDEPGAIACLRTKNIQKELDDSDLIYVPSSVVKREEQALQECDLLISSANSWGLVGKTVRVGKLSYPATAGGFISILRPDRERIDPDYLFRFISWARTQHEIRHLGRQTTNISNLDRERFLELPIPLPPLPTQRHIAKVLEQADSLRRQAQQMEAEFDRLAQALFRDMFGDYRQQAAKNFVPLAKVADVVSGVAKGGKLTGAVRSLPYLRVANVQDGFLNLSEIKKIEATERDIEKYRLKAGDILMTEGGDFDKLGRGAMWSGEIAECIHQNHIFRVRLSDAYEPRFFECYLRTPMVKTYFLGCAKKTTNLASINMSQLKALPTPKESLGRQKQFVVALQKIEAQRQMARRQQVELEQAFQSLTQRAFKGELTPKLA
ncbi:MAG: restriction endonuclease subunit S [Pseudomonas asiatica]